ncbi:MAG TPA: hypothetical protein VD886_03765, partial [Herpetosiphonaceae bacterium]|nr:hypothetical protein [Herpetosiphonaceae bacterium]
MTDPVPDRRAAFQQLERLIAQSERLYLEALQQPQLAAEDYAALVKQYQGWYAAGLAALPEDLGQAFRAAYEDLPFQPRLETYLAHARDPNPDPEQRSAARSPWKYPFDYGFHQLVNDQRSTLYAFRARLLALLSAVPGELKDLVASVFGGKDHSVLTVDSLFAQAGARREWWVRPAAVTGKKRDRVRGWLDGVLIHAPEREQAIVEAVCRAIIRHDMAAQATAARIQAMLDRLAPDEASAEAPPDAHLYIAPERLEELRQIAEPPFDLSRLIRLGEELNL